MKVVRMLQFENIKDKQPGKPKKLGAENKSTNQPCEKLKQNFLKEICKGEQNANNPRSKTKT